MSVELLKPQVHHNMSVELLKPQVHPVMSCIYVKDMPVQHNLLCQMALSLK